MRKFTLLVLPIFLSSCAQLPDSNPAFLDSEAKPTVATWLPPILSDDKATKLLLCDSDIPRQACSASAQGLNAVGLGGLFLPLKVLIPKLTLKGNQADIHVDINGKKAACASGSFDVSENSTSVKIGNIYCNWLLIGNVVSSLKLSFDWDDPETRSFGGRYLIRFLGTGNGSGSGFYSAEVQS